MLVIAVGVLLVAAVASTFLVPRRSDVDEARSLLRDQDRFARGTTAGETLTQVSVHLQRAGEKCRDDRCDRYFTAAALLRVSAVAALRCRRTELLAMRVAFDSYVDGLASDRSPAPPALPAC